MKKILLGLLVTIVCLTGAQQAHGQLSVPLGGTGRTSTPFDYILVGSSTGKLGAKALVAGTNITITSTTNSFTINATSSPETDPIWSAFLLNPIFTNLTSTNFFATNTLFINASSTNLFAGALTFTSATGTNLYISSLANIVKLGVNSSSPIAQLAVTAVAGTEPMRVVSSTNAQLFAVKANGQVVIGPNSLSQTGQLSVETPTTNDYALTFTNGSHYTAMLGRQPGTSGQMAIGGLGGTSLNLWAGGSSGMIILNTNRFVGINSSSPSTRFVVVGTTTLDGFLAFTTASGTSITSTNAFFSNLNFTNATGTTLYLSSSLNINNALTVDSSGNVSASGTMRVFRSATFGSLADDFVAFQRLPTNQTTTTIDYLSDPEILSRGTAAADTLAVYSDNINRIWVQGTAIGTGISLKNRSLVPANTNLDSYYNNAGTVQTITATNILGFGGGATVRGVLTYQGYDYVLAQNGGAFTWKRATSSPTVDASVIGGWDTVTVSGFTFDGAELGLVGAANGNIYMASNTLEIIPFAITTSTNTVTAGTPIVFTGTIEHSLSCTRVNDNGIYTCDTTAPTIRLFDFSGNPIITHGLGFGSASPSTAGPTIFATRYSLYTEKGGSPGLTKQ